MFSTKQREEDIISLLEEFSCLFGQVIFPKLINGGKGVLIRSGALEKNRDINKNTIPVFNLV